ncbi:hypothetical protein E4U15_003554 [Claviceps sp. LM218 group G6]|nr:hypothetical protein E4U15_003554 [Claviceps sp. LM218 group G6]
MRPLESVATRDSRVSDPPRGPLCVSVHCFPGRASTASRLRKLEASIALPRVDSGVVWFRVEDLRFVDYSIVAQSVCCFDAISEPGRNLGDPGAVEGSQLFGHFVRVLFVGLWTSGRGKTRLDDDCEHSTGQKAAFIDDVETANRLCDNGIIYESDILDAQPYNAAVNPRESYRCFKFGHMAAHRATQTTHVAQTSEMRSMRGRITRPWRRRLPSP